MIKTTRGVLEEVFLERQRQERKWGTQNHPDGTSNNVYALERDLRISINANKSKLGTLTWADILDEEYMEALAESSEINLRAELIQVAAVAVAWIEDIDRRKSNGSVSDWENEGGR